MSYTLTDFIHLKKPDSGTTGPVWIVYLEYDFDLIDSEFKKRHVFLMSGEVGYSDSGEYSLWNVKQIKEQLALKSNQGHGHIYTEITGLSTISFFDNIPTIENLQNGKMVNIFDNNGVATVRKADATAIGKEVDGFCVGSSLSGEYAIIQFSEVGNNFSSLSPGKTYYLSTISGEITDIAPSTPGNIVQKVGKALSTTKLIFSPGRSIELS